MIPHRGADTAKIHTIIYWNVDLTQPLCGINVLKPYPIYLKEYCLRLSLMKMVACRDEAHEILNGMGEPIPLYLEGI